MIEALLWDLDGTILDTSDLIFNSYRFAFEKILKKNVSDDETLQHFGKPLEHVMISYSSDRSRELVEAYREYNLSNHDSSVHPFPGIRDTLSNLQRQRFRQVVVTSKTVQLASWGLELFDLKQYIETVIGLESTDMHKPSPEPALEALKWLRMQPNNVLFVGDSETDYKCAHSAGIAFIAAMWGPNPGRMSEIDADFKIEDPRDLLHIVPQRKPLR